MQTTAFLRYNLCAALRRPELAEVRLPKCGAIFLFAMRGGFMQSLRVLWCVVFALLATVGECVAQQLTVTLQMSPQPSPYLSDWQEQRETATLIVQNNGTGAVFVRLHTQVFEGAFTDGVLVAETKLNEMPVLVVGPGVSLFNPADFIPLYAVRFLGNADQTAARTGKLPAGMFTICIGLVEAETLQPITAPACTGFVLTDYQAPVLLQPADSELLAPELLSALTFRWTPVFPVSSSPVEYTLRVFEVLPGQDPLQAFRGNTPLIEVTRTNTTQLLLPPEFERPQRGRQYIWSVQAHDGGGRPLGSNDGYAEPFVFTVSSGRTTSSCQCPECFINGIGIYQNGVLLTGSSVSSGGTVVFKPNIIAQCAAPCVLSIDGNWSITVVGADGVTRTQQYRGSEVQWQGMGGEQVHIVFTGAIFCGEARCPCGTTPTEARVRVVPRSEVGRVDSSIVRRTPHDGEIVPVDSIPIETPPERPPDTVTVNTCGQQVSREVATPISVGMIVEEPTTFPYPRAVPIRGDAIDWDYANFYCVDKCNKTVSMIKMPVRDAVQQYKWTLLGKGSLNVPFDDGAADSLDALLAQSAARLSAIEQALDSLTQRKDDIPKELQHQKERAQEQMRDIDSAIAQAEKALRATTDSLSAVRDSLKHVLQWRTTLADRIRQGRDSVSRAEDSLAWYKEKLQNKPTQTEQTALQDIANKRQEVERADTAVVQVQQLIIDEAKQLQAAIASAGVLLNQANDIYDQIKNQGEELAQQTTQLQRQIYAGAGRRYFTMSRQWNTLALALIGQYFSSNAAMLVLQEEINNAAEQALVETDPVQRQQLFQQFVQQSTVFTTRIADDCQRLSDTAQRTPCANVAALVSSAMVQYRTVVDSLVRSAYQLPRAQLAQLRQVRSAIHGMEQPIRDAKQQAEQAASAYEQALTAYTQTMERREIEKNRAMASAQVLRGELAALEHSYKAMVQQRETAFEQAKDGYILRQHVFESLRQASMQRVALAIDSLALADADTTALNTRRVLLQRDSSQWAEQQQVLKETKNGLQKILDIDVQKLLAPIEKEIATLTAEKQQIEQQLASLHSQKSSAVAGSKSAMGQLVYYIPPPLEEILQNPQRFAELKDSVVRAEAALIVAKEHKAAVQAQLLQRVETVGKSLVVYKKADDLIEQAEHARDSLDRALQTMRNEKTSVYTDYQKKLQDILRNAQSTKDSAQQRIQTALADSMRLHGQIQTVEQALQQQQGQVRQDSIALATARQQQENLAEQLQQVRQDVRTKTESYEQQQEKAAELKYAYGRAQNDVSRSIALDSLQAVSTAQQRMVQSQKELDNHKKNLATTEQALAAQAHTHEQAAQQARSADSVLLQKAAQLTRSQQKFALLHDSLRATHAQYREALSSLIHWRAVRGAAEQLEHKADSARAQFQKEIATIVDNDADVQEQQKAVAAQQREKENAQRAQEKAERLVARALAERDSLLAEAEQHLQQAQSDVERARQDLRTFLLDEFNRVSHADTLILEVDGDQIDSWRSDDKEQKMIKVLSYQGTRIPVFPSEYPKGALPPVEQQTTCHVALPLNPLPEIVAIPPSLAQQEPRTIALLYKRGEPLWPEWPVIPKAAPVLAKDVVVVAADGTDNDGFTHICQPPNQDCKTAHPIIGGMRDLLSFQWSGDGRFIAPKQYERVLWEPPDIATPDCRLQKLIETGYEAKEIIADKKVEKRVEPLIHPGVLIEVPDSLLGYPGFIDTARARIVRGDHTGLVGEEVEFAVALVSGEAQDYGFDGSDTVVVKKTEGDGYAIAPFNFGKGFAVFHITVTWKRASGCDTRTFTAVSPLYLQFLQFTSGVPLVAWNVAKKVWAGASLADAASSMPAASDTAEYQPDVYAVAGYLNENRDSVNGEVLKFQPKGKFSVNPDSAETELFGIVRTDVVDPPQQGVLTLTAQCSDAYKPVCRPPEHTRSYNTSGIDRFKIGEKNDLFTIIVDEPVSRGQEVNGTGKLAVTVGGVLVVELSKLTFDIRDVVLEEQGNDFIAVAGYVSWKAPEGIRISTLGFGVALDSVVVRANAGAGIGGTLQHSSLERPVQFYAEMNTAGEFYGEVANLPHIVVAGFTLKEGAAFVLDMSRDKSEAAFPNDFKGIVIVQAALELPALFADKESEQPTVLSATNFAIGSSGLSGTLALHGAPHRITFARFAFQADSISLTFKDGALDGGAFSGALSLPMPFEGAVRTTISKAGNSWAAAVSTDNPVTIPRLKTVFALRTGTGVFWDADKSLGAFRLNAVVTSEKIGAIDIAGFEINSNGIVKADEIAINKTVKFGGGFFLDINSVSFAIAQGEYSLKAKGGFGFPLFGANQLRGTVSVAPGPIVSVALDSAAITIEYKPVSLKGAIAFSGSEFKGEFDVSIEKLLPNGIQGMLVVGSLPIDSLNSYTYWYAELLLGTKIPLGSTGLSLLEMGGGVGYNYDPPIGDQEGAPRKTDAFSVKAIVGIGNAPGGELFAGRMTMVLVSGRFSLNGKLWLLQQEKSMFGEGQLNVYWEPEAKLDGYVRMFIGIPDADGKILRFNGKVNYFFAGTQNFFVKSEEITGSLFNLIHAEAALGFTRDSVFVNGRLFYDYDGEFPFWPVTVLVALHVEASAAVVYRKPVSTLEASVGFVGTWDVDLDTPLGKADIISGAVVLDKQQTRLVASPAGISMTAKARVSWDVWFYSDSAELDVGFTL